MARPPPTGQPLRVTKEWGEQTLVLEPDPAQWTCLGSRHDRTDLYGDGEIVDVLRDTNVDLIFVLFPLNIVPTEAVADLHHSRAEADYQPDRRYLPDGVLMLDTVRIDYPG